MKMRYVVVPAPIKLINPSTGKALMKRMLLANGRIADTDQEQEVFTVRRMVTDIILADPALGSGWKAALVANALLEGFHEGVTEGDVVALAQEHWERVKAILEAPSQGLSVDPIVNGQIVPMYQAFMDASDKSPATVKSE